MAQKKRGVSADRMFFDDIDDDDEEFDLDGIEMDDIAGMLSDDIDLDEISVDDLDDMLGGDDLPDLDDRRTGAGAAGKGATPAAQGASRGGGWQDDLDDETLLEADLAAAEGHGGQARGQGQQRSQGQQRGKAGGKRRPGDGQGTQAKAQPQPQPKPAQPASPSPYDEPDGDEDETEQLVVPQWVVSINSKLNGNVSHAFLLEGNIRDYMVRNISIKDGIIQTLDPYQDAFDVIASYDQAHGLTFDTSTMSNEVSPDEYKGRFVELMREAQHDLDMPQSDEIPRDPVAVFSIISKIMEMPAEVMLDEEGGEFYRAKMLLFIDYPEMLVPQVSGAPREAERQLAIIINDLCRSELVDQSGCCIIMMTDNVSSMSERVRSTSSRVDRVNVPMPLLEERRDFIHHVLAIDENVLSDGRKIFECEEGVTEDYLAINTAGLARFQIEDIVLRSLADDVPVTPELVKERKSEIVTNDYNDVIEILDPKHGFKEVGGMQQLKDFFREEVINPIHRGELEAVPMGVLFMGPPGSGKAVRNTEKIIYRSADGTVHRKNFGDIKIGDCVLNRHGEWKSVVGVYPQGKKDLYRVSLKDGRSVVVSGDHIWGYWHTTDRSQGPVTFLDTITTTEMLERGLRWPGNNAFRFYLPICEPTDFPEADLPVHPYVVGALAGDGCTTVRQAILISADEEVVQQVAEGLRSPFFQPTALGKFEEHGFDGRAYGWKFALPDDVKAEYIQYRKEQGRKVFPSRIKWFTGEYVTHDIPELHGSAYEKSIPEIYKTASLEQRLELLRGYFDTDGSAIFSCNRLSVKFTTISEQLMNDIREMLFSVGLSSSVYYREISKTPIKYKGQDYFSNYPSYEVSVHGKPERLLELFSLPRKKQKILDYMEYASDKSSTNAKHHDKVAVTEIVKLDEVDECTCIKVDDDEELFIITENYIVTHNTMLAKAIAHESNMNCVNLNLSRILNKYVGGSEQNLDRALDCAMAMQPTIIFIDEIDEALPKRNGADQSGVSQRINKRLLEFFSQTEHRGQVMILAATNYPEKIDPAFKRAGRFDNRLPMFAPGKYDRSRILHISAAKARYTVSAFLDPDTLMTNPFRRLKRWLQDGNTPNLENSIYDMMDYEYTAMNSLNRPVKMHSQIPKRLYRIIDKPKISLEEFYRSCDILFSGGEFPTRGGDEVGEDVLTDEQYHEALIEFFAMHSDIFGRDARVHAFCARWILYREAYFDQFGDLTVGKTGAELDVVINKCISLYRTFKAENPERFKQMLERKEIENERDIPWAIVLDACSKTTAAVSGIKSMEDFALIDTSDTDYIPDEEYGRLSSNKTISYRERQEQLLTRMKLLAGDNENTAELLKA